MKEAVIVALGRSPIGKANRGLLKDTRPEELGSQVLKGVLAKVPQLPLTEIEDIIVGCAFPEAEQGMNMAKIVAAKAGLPENTAGQTINRFCASGLQAIATAANGIISGQNKVMVAGGVESMSTIPMGGNMLYPDTGLMDNAPKELISMGLTAENVAAKYGITRQMQDEFAVESHTKSNKAQESGRFDSEIIPIQAAKTVRDENGNLKTVNCVASKDEGIRKGITFEDVSKLRPVFKMGGSVTAGNASQMSDGASMVVLMERERAESLGIKPLAKFISFASVGVPAEEMGIGPIKAIPKALEIANLTLDDIDLIELNEAFASQSLACIKELGINKDIVNVNGGAISLGHPLGCTGAFLTTKLVNELQARKQRYGIVSMCIGGGMGAAGVFEVL